MALKKEHKESISNIVENKIKESGLDETQQKNNSTNSKSKNKEYVRKTYLIKKELISKIDNIAWYLRKEKSDILNEMLEKAISVDNTYQLTLEEVKKIKGN